METIKILSGKEERTLPLRGEATLLTLFQNNGVEISAPCGGNGKCGKCAVLLTVDGKTERVSACRTKPVAGASVRLPDGDGSGLVTDGALTTDGEKGVGLALDVGTTTLAFCFADLETGATLFTYACLNPQRTFGADVISRIEYATQKGVSAMTEALRLRVNAVISDFNLQFGKTVQRLFVTGNTVMLHVFCGEDVSSFGYAPFTPKFLSAKTFAGKDLGYLSESVTILPSFASFVGADIVCGAVATDLTKANNLMVDLGTNGEILLCYRNRLYATSVAAGPAFEGADIECGTGGVEGAVASVTLAEGKPQVKTVGNKPAVGICGSGLVDALSCMLQTGVVDETGAMQQEDNYFLTDKIYVSGRDVRKFQLAKGAVRAGIECLLSASGATFEDLDGFFVCGGLGYYISPESATRVGLFPKALQGKLQPKGNTALLGAKACMLKEATFQTALSLAKEATVVDLSANPLFTEKFAEFMFFGEN